MKDPYPKTKEIFSPFIYPTKDRVQLSRNFEVEGKDFLDVILNRVSSRTFKKFTQADLDQLLYHCCRIKSFDIDETGFFLTKRITPSAGSRHPIDLLISMPKKIRDLCYYNPLDHTLSELEINEHCLNNFFSSINENIPLENACLIWFSIQVEKTNSKYENPESLYWKDAGVLIYAIQLISTYLGLNSCPLGTLATDSFHHLFNENRLVSGGGILIGKD